MTEKRSIPNNRMLNHIIVRCIIASTLTLTEKKKPSYSMLALRRLRPINSVSSLVNTPFLRRTREEKLQVKELGVDRHDLSLKQQAKDGHREYTRCFSRSWYERKRWLTGCHHAWFLCPYSNKVPWRTKFSVNGNFDKCVSTHCTASLSVCVSWDPQCLQPHQDK